MISPSTVNTTSLRVVSFRAWASARSTLFPRVSVPTSDPPTTIGRTATRYALRPSMTYPLAGRLASASRMRLDREMSMPY